MLEEKILELLKENPGQNARSLASQLQVDKKQVNGILYGSLKGKVIQDKKYCWSVVVPKSKDETVESEVRYQNTDLAKLCRYYLACMGQDDIGVSTFAQSKYDQPDYCELSILPTNSEELCADQQFQEIRSRVRSDRSPQAMYLGYPTGLKLLKSNRSNWEGFMVEPILLFPIELGTNSKTAHLDISYPIINQKALKSLTGSGQEDLMEELVQLEKELGIEGDENRIDIDEIVMRLQSIRPEWTWKEDVNPEKISSGAKPLSEIDEEGIYNRALIIIAEKSPFTQGLESELRELASKNDLGIEGTALKGWLTGDVESKEEIEPKELIEVLPMNLEQHDAVQSALTKPLTIITGPPGTGKSQVVTNLLINAAWQGKRVLFASKNNKAVDVVETRVNNLGNRPILLRLGSSAYQSKLAEYLMAFLSTSVTQDEKMEFEEAFEVYRKLVSKIETLDNEMTELIDVRNLTDKQERQIEEYRSQFSTELFQSFRDLDLNAPLSDLRDFKVGLDRYDREQQNWFVKVGWPLFKNARSKEVSELVPNLKALTKQFNHKLPLEDVNEADIGSWRSFINILKEDVEKAVEIQDYFEALEKLQSSKPLEEISKEKVLVMEKIASNSESLWRLWLKIQPSKLSSADKNLLSKYNSVLKMVVESSPDKLLSKSVYKEYKTLASKVSHLLPCWAVTSLSAKGKLPFSPGVFDLVVFDEASQCDIASALPLLYRAKAAVVIGDPKQLSHISSLKKGQDQQLLDKFNLVKDYPHWGYSYNSLFDLASGLISNDNVINLLDHHRSHADVIEFSNEQFYEGRLRVATRYDRLRRVSAKEPGARWVNVKGIVKRPSAGGAFNMKEVDAVVKTLEELVLEKKYDGSVGVVSPFRAQANAIRVAVESNAALAKALNNREFLSDTVHKFQGDERDVMLFSPVVSKGMTPGGLGFLSGNGNLFNVAITRARAQVIVVGDLSECQNCGVSYLSNFAKYTQELNEKVEQDLVEAQEEYGQKYPEVNNPDQVSDWERIFYSALYDAGIRTLPQYKVEKYSLDLAIIDGERRLDIEVDGEKYHRNWTGELCRRDQIRNHRLYELGWDVMRFWVYEIRDDLEGCVKRVKQWQSNLDKVN